MDHLRISGNEPSSVILSQTNCQIKLMPKGMVYKTHKITISINFNTENFGALKRYEQTEVDRRTLPP